MLKNLRTAYRGWFAIIGVLVSALALLNFSVRFFEIGLSQLMLDALHWYHVLFHGFWDSILKPFHVELSSGQKDFLTLWVMLGGLFSWTVNYVYESGYGNDFAPGVIGVSWLDERVGDSRLLRRLVCVLCVFLIWPYFLFRFYKLPYLISAGGFGLYLSEKKHPKSRHTIDLFKYDSRVIFLIYFVSLIGAVAAFFSVNAFLPV